MSFIVHISPFVHLFTLKIVFRWGLSPLNPHQGSGRMVVGFTTTYAIGAYYHLCYEFPSRSE